jgi:uncharacterized membrane protein
MENEKKENHEKIEENKEREFQLRILEVQLKHEHDVTFFTVMLAVGASFVVFGLTFMITFLLSEREISVLWVFLSLGYEILGAICFILSVIKLRRLKFSQEKDVNAIRQDFSVTKV